MGDCLSLYLWMAQEEESRDMPLGQAEGDRDQSSLSANQTDQSSLSANQTAPIGSGGEVTAVTATSTDTEDDDYSISKNCAVATEVAEVIQKLSAEFQTLNSSLQRANILLVGKTGVGKSSLVNAVFGGVFAETGTGEPVTQHLHRYAPDNKPVVVFDTKGLEHGNHDRFIEETVAFLNELRSSEDLREHLHVVWYVIDMAHARFQPFEEKICREVLGGIPLFFVLNKVDTAKPAQVATIRELVESQNFPSCRGVFEVVCDRQNYDPECCPLCGSEDIRVRHKTKQLFCDGDDCGVCTPMHKTAGLEPLVGATINQLPNLARHSFINAQEVSEMERVHCARDIIHRHADQITLRHSGETLVAMASELALLWDFRFFPTVVSEEIAFHVHDRYSSKSVLGRLALILSDLLSSHRVSEALGIAMGVELCRMLCEVKMQALGCAMHPQGAVPADVDNVLGFDLSDIWLAQVERGIKEQGRAAVIDEWLTKKVAVVKKKMVSA